MPQWIHDRADHIRGKNPGMSKSQSFAIATQQAYAAGKAPKTYGTSEGRQDAKRKYDSPKSEYKKVADPSEKTSGISLASLLGFTNELQKLAFSAPKPTTVGDMRKVVSSQGTALSTRKLSYSKVREPAPTASSSELAASAKTVQPPPVSMPNTLS